MDGLLYINQNRVLSNCCHYQRYLNQDKFPISTDCRNYGLKYTHIIEIFSLNYALKCCLDSQDTQKTYHKNLKPQILKTYYKVPNKFASMIRQKQVELISSFLGRRGGGGRREWMQIHMEKVIISFIVQCYCSLEMWHPW